MRIPIVPTFLAAVLPAAIGAKPLDLQMGSRGFGMGGAFAAISDDATAAYWNPAGLSRLTSLTFSETNWILQDVEGVNVNYFTGAIPVSLVGTVSGGWLMQHATLEQGEPGTTLHGESDWFEHAFSLAAGRELWKKLGIFERTSIGFSLDRYVLNSGELNGAGTGFDIGFLTGFPHGLRLGLVARSLGADMMGEKIDPEYRLGFGYEWDRNRTHRVILALDLATKENVEYLDGEEGVERNYKGFLGAEYRFSRDEWQAALRTGLNSSFRNSRDMNAYTGGFGVGYKGIGLEYAFLFNSNQDLSLGHSHRFTLEVSLGALLGDKNATAAAETKPAAPTGAKPPAQSELDMDLTEDERKKVEAIKAKYRSGNGE